MEFVSWTVLQVTKKRLRFVRTQETQRVLTKTSTPVVSGTGCLRGLVGKSRLKGPWTLLNITLVHKTNDVCTCSCLCSPHTRGDFGLWIIVWERSRFFKSPRTIHTHNTTYNPSYHHPSRLLPWSTLIPGHHGERGGLGGRVLKDGRRGVGLVRRLQGTWI